MNSMRGGAGPRSCKRQHKIGTSQLTFGVTSLRTYEFIEDLRKLVEYLCQLVEDPCNLVEDLCKLIEDLCKLVEDLCHIVVSKVEDEGGGGCFITSN